MPEKSELNPFEIKAEISNILTKLSDVKDFESYKVHYRMLDIQSDKNIIVKLLFKEINTPQKNPELLKFLLARYCPKDELVERLWSIIKNNMASNNAKIFVLDLLRDIDANWSYEQCDKYLDNPDELVNSDTKKILDNAIANPEVQIDFLDFLNSLPDSDQIILLESLAADYSQNELANMLIPVFLSMSDTETGRKALEILGNSKSQLAYHALNTALESVKDELKPAIKKNLSVLKLAGIREDNSLEFYKDLLKDSKPYKFCITYPDGHGNQAVIVSRIKKTGAIQFVAIVIDDYKGIRDCFGFNEISKFECNTIIERFYRAQRALELDPGVLKSILLSAEKISADRLPYEYVCWKNLLADIETIPLKLNYSQEKLSQDEFETILKSDFTDYWFLNSTYSDEYEEFLKELALITPEDYDKFIDKNVEKVFFDSEFNIWHERIMHTAILKHFTGDYKTAKNLCSLYNDKKLVREFFKNILRKSIYEYYFAKNEKEKVSAIEEMWVK